MQNLKVVLEFLRNMYLEEGLGWKEYQNPFLSHSRSPLWKIRWKIAVLALDDTFYCKNYNVPKTILEDDDW